MKIVVLDDSKTMRMTLRLLLEETGFASSDIALFEEGRDALAHLAECGADLIFTDVSMPGMDGFEFVARLRAVSPALLDATFVVSADEHSDGLQRMRDLGIRRFIRKPIDPALFRERIAPFAIPENRGSAAAASGGGIADHETLAREIGIPVKYVPRLLESFFSESDHHLALLKNAIGQKDYGQIERSAHAIKGSAGNMKFDGLSKQAKLIEIAAHLQDDAYDYPSALSTVERLLASLFAKR